jgi:hypothetical protein
MQIPSFELRGSPYLRLSVNSNSWVGLGSNDWTQLEMAADDPQLSRRNEESQKQFLNISA